MVSSSFLAAFLQFSVEVSVIIKDIIENILFNSTNIGLLKNAVSASPKFLNVCFCIIAWIFGASEKVNLLSIPIL